MTTLASIVHHEIWVGWRQEIKNGRPTKIPYDPRTGRLAASDNPNTWATYDEAANWAAMHSGGDGGGGLMLGRLPTGANCRCGVDLDTCRDPNTGDIAAWAQAVIDRFATYTETSPSRTGVKLFFVISTDDLPDVAGLLGAGKTGRLFKRPGAGHPPSIELYCGLRFFTVTWESIGETDELRTANLADLEWLIRDHGPKFVGESPNPKDKPRDDSRSGRAFRDGAALKAGGATYEEMRDALLQHADPEIAEWARTKGMADGERELHRIYDKAWPKERS